MADNLSQQDWLIAGLKKILSDEHIFNRYKAIKNQRKVAKESGDRKAINGVGRLRMEVDDYVYHYWGNRLGYKCWKDPQFLREMERDNPEVRVKCGGTKMQVGWTSNLTVPIGIHSPRFRKAYAA